MSFLVRIDKPGLGRPMGRLGGRQFHVFVWFKGEEGPGHTVRVFAFIRPQVQSAECLAERNGYR